MLTTYGKEEIVMFSNEQKDRRKKGRGRHRK